MSFHRVVESALADDPLPAGVDDSEVIGSVRNDPLNVAADTKLHNSSNKSARRIFSSELQEKEADDFSTTGCNHLGPPQATKELPKHVRK